MIQSNPTEIKDDYVFTYIFKYTNIKAFRIKFNVLQNEEIYLFFANNLIRNFSFFDNILPFQWEFRAMFIVTELLMYCNGDR